MVAKKISMLGAYRVGKTSLVRQFIQSMFDDKYHVTIGVKTDKKMIVAAGKDVTLMVWDVAGAEDQFTVPNSYIRGTAGYLLVIDGTNLDTLDRAFDLVEQVDDAFGRLPLVVLLNKADLTEQWQIDDAAKARLAPLNCPVLRTSAKTGENVEEAFRLLTEQIMAAEAGG